MIDEPCSNTSEKKSFSVLKVKNYLRPSLANEKLSTLSILCIEDQIVKNIKWTGQVNRFSKLKVRKNTFI